MTGRVGVKSAGVEAARFFAAGGSTEDLKKILQDCAQVIPGKGIQGEEEKNNERQTQRNE